MIGQVMKNSALCAKIHAMRGDALTDADYRAMMNMKSVPDVAGYLIENTRYGRALGGVSPAQIHRGGLERLLAEDLNTDIERLMPYMGMGGKRFIEITEIEEGISILKICVRLLSIGRCEDVEGYMEKLRDTGTADKISCGGITSIDELIERLRGTPYYGAMRYFKGRAERQKPFFIEMRLDTYWTHMVYKYIKKYVPKAERAAVSRLYGTEFDLENLTFLLRCKKSFDMTDEEVYACVIHHYCRLKESTVKNIVGAASYDDALKVIKTETPYGEAFSTEDRFLEKRVREYILHMSERAYSSNQYSIMAPVSYIWMRRIEIKNIISVTEGIRYGLEPDRIDAYLIRNGRNSKGGNDI